MKFEDAKLDMKVIADGPIKIRGVITAIDDKEKSVRVKGERLIFWFFQNAHTEYDIKYLKEDPRARYVDNPPKFNAEKVKFVPKENQEYWGIGIIDGQPLCMTCNSAFYDHLINMAIGNCFRTADEASKHRDEIRKRFIKLIAYAITLNS